MTDCMTRMGDGRRVTMTRQQIREDVEAGTNDAQVCTEVPVLTADELDFITDILCSKSRIQGVEPGHEVVLTLDGGPTQLLLDNGNSGSGIEMGRVNAVAVYERAFAIDLMEQGMTDYSIKPGKALLAYEQQAMEQVLRNSTVPMLYGAMPNMGLYYSPDGAYGNPADLMREFKIEEAMDQAEKAAKQLEDDTVYFVNGILSTGADGFDFDTTASAGDADFVSTLRAIERIKDEYPEAGIVTGMSGENVLGIHGSIDFHGTPVAGLYPNEQAKLCADAGATIFGCVVNTNSSKSAAWNIARAVTIAKDCSKNSPIPVHVDMGMGVGGVPMFETPATDIVAKAATAMVEVGKIDGI